MCLTAISGKRQVAGGAGAEEDLNKKYQNDTQNHQAMIAIITTTRSQ